MRIAALATSAILLSGCSWLGLGDNSSHHRGDYNYGAQAAGRYHAQQHAGHQAPRAHQGYNQQRGYGPCEITSVSQPVPQGCSPEQVTIALPGAQSGGGYNSQGQYQAPASGTYGRSLGDINRAQAAADQGYHKNWTRPRFRLTGTTGFERSVSGEAFDANALSSIYNPATHSNGFSTGSEAGGQVIRTLYVPGIGGTINPADAAAALAQTGSAETQVSHNRVSDIYGAPFTLGAGAEYQLNDRFAIFGNASYTAAEGGEGSRSVSEADVHQLQITTNYIEDAGNPGTFIENGTPALSNTYLTDVIVARTSATTNDLRRGNLEIGGRYYFKDAFPQYLERPVTPYVSASAGAAHYNALEVSQQSEILGLNTFWDDPANPQYSRETASSAVEILKDGWVPTGSVTVGAEWQVTPKAALAFETGLRYEGGRDVTAGGETDENFAIPLTIRGSIGF